MVIFNNMDKNYEVSCSYKLNRFFKGNEDIIFYMSIKSLVIGYSYIEVINDDDEVSNDDFFLYWFFGRDFRC